MGEWHDPKVVAALVATVISLFGVGISYYFNSQNRKVAQTNISIARFNLAQSQRSSLYSWASSCQETLSLALISCASLKIDDPEAKKNILRALTQLTALIDEGRWLLPNSNNDLFGNHKEEAYKGFRDGALDHLVSVYKILESVVDISTFEQEEKDSSSHLKNHHSRLKLGSEPQTAKMAVVSIGRLKREFTSDIQTKLQPHKAAEDFNRLIGQ